MKAIKALIVTACVMFHLWIFISWVDVVTHNLTTCVYQPWNFFQIFF